MTQDRMSSKEYRQRMGLAPSDGATVAKAKPQIRIPKPRRMNKTEAEWMEHLKRKYHPAITTIRYEAITLRLPSGRYTPDFFVHQSTTNNVEFWEVKGPFIKNPASIRAFKEAIIAYPMFNFYFAQKLKTGWTTTEPDNNTTKV